MLVPALSQPTEALGELVWDLWFDSCHTSIGLCWLDFISHAGQAGSGDPGHCQLRRAQNVLQHSHRVSHGMVAPWGWGPLGGMGTACSSLHTYCLVQVMESETTSNWKGPMKIIKSHSLVIKILANSGW